MTKTPLAFLTVARGARCAPCPQRTPATPDTTAVECHGFADRIDLGEGRLTKEEIQLYDCDRQWGCCIAPFRCRRCGHRFLCRIEAPELA